MRIDVVRPAELGAAELARWTEIQESDPDLASPYFSPEFTRSVAEARSDVYTAVIEIDGRIEGFFPFQRRRFGLGSPAGGRFSDVHGILLRPGVPVSFGSVLRACRLACWEFHGLPVGRTPFFPPGEGVEEAHYLDLSRGFEGYEAALRDAGSSQPKRLGTARRRLERDFQKVEFIPHVEDPAVLDSLIEWKSRQYRESGLRDSFSFPWTISLLRRIHSLQTPGFAGMLSALRVDGEYAALHMGMRSRRVWHWWFPRHEEKFAKHSPGILLLYYCAMHAPQIGVTRIDLGPGGEEYKLRLRSGAMPLARGRVEMASVTMSALRCRESVERWVRNSPLESLARVPGRLVKRFEAWRRFR